MKSKIALNLHLGLDARLYGLKHAGIGRYLENLVTFLIQAQPVNRLSLILDPSLAKSLVVPQWVQKVPVSIPHYSLAEQFRLPPLISSLGIDLMHYPHFNVPYFSPVPYLVTIHDILWHQVRGSSVTTLSPFLYYPKYLGYRIIVGRAVNQSQAIIVPSQFVKTDLLRAYPRLSPSKIKVIYEGADHLTITKPPLAPPPPSPYLVYLGSAYPHKNIPLIFQSLKSLLPRYPDLTLKIIGSRSVFLDSLKATAHRLGIASSVKFLGYQTDSAVKALLSRAVCLVHPSFSEGFGLTGLEAMASACPVVASRAGSLPEIYGSAALYFDPHRADDLTSNLERLLTHPSLRLRLLRSGNAQIKKYRWSDTIISTINTYRQISQHL